VVVDSSKIPDVLATAVVRDRPLHVLHLVRDPRAVSYSSLQPKADLSNRGTMLKQRAAWKTAVFWNRNNVLTERVVRSARRRRAQTSSVLVTYEDLVAAPERVVSELVGPLPHDGSCPRGGWHHAVAANPSLYEERRPIVADRRWESGLSQRDTAVTTALTAPLLNRYGYAVRPSRSRVEPSVR
jgi:hypothetical protein